MDICVLSSSYHIMYYFNMKTYVICDQAKSIQKKHANAGGSIVEVVIVDGHVSKSDFIQETGVWIY